MIAISLDLSECLKRYDLQLERQIMPSGIGGFFVHDCGLRRMVVNSLLLEERQIAVCRELVDHLRQDETTRFVVCDLTEPAEVHTLSTV